MGAGMCLHRLCRSVLVLLSLVVMGSGWLQAQAPGAFVRRWLHAGETSAVIYWQLESIEKSARSYVEYGLTAAYGQQTALSGEARLAQFHRLTGLNRNSTYHYRMVNVSAGQESRSEDLTLSTADIADAIHIPAEVSGPPYVLNQPNRHYVLTQNISATGSAIQINGAGVNLDLDGHTVTFGTSSSSMVFGVSLSGQGAVTVKNGHIVQGTPNGYYSAAIGSSQGGYARVISGISTSVHGLESYPVKLLNQNGVDLHHNNIISSVSEIVDRHSPGNDIVRLTQSGAGTNSIHDNLVTEGIHKGITVTGSGPVSEVSYNDIRHHSRYVNGYALKCESASVHIHHNRVTSIGRGIHITQPSVTVNDNYLNLTGHGDLDRPQGSSDPWEIIRVELHGIKFEGPAVTGSRVYNNFVRIIQPLPDAQWDYVPATPLNITATNPNGMNEVYDNTFIALTEYPASQHGGYGNAGHWACPLYFVGMTAGASQSGNHAVYMHNNTFQSNDCFVGAASGTPNMTIRIENNSFQLLTPPPLTTNRVDFYNIGSYLTGIIEAGGNTFGEVDQLAPAAPGSLRRVD